MGFAKVVGASIVEIPWLASLWNTVAQHITAMYAAIFAVAGVVGAPAYLIAFAHFFSVSVC